MTSLYERSLKVLPPVAQRATKLGIVRGSGLHLTDEAGVDYLDFAAGVGVVNCGHNNPQVVAAVDAQLHELIHGGHNVVYYPSYIQLAEKMTQRLGGDYKVYFSNSGAEANEGAVKLAMQVTHRDGVIAFTGSFHGRTMLTTSMTASGAIYHENYQGMLPPVYHVDFPDIYNTDLTADQESDRCIQQLRQLFKTTIAADQVACIVVEPVQGEGGYIPAPKVFLEKLQAICQAQGILLIFDEVQSGYGRTGTWFAFEQYGVTPDILTAAKGIANGLPLSAVLAKSALMDQWTPGTHGGTFGGNPLACAAGCAVLDIMDADFLAHVRQTGAYFMAKLQTLQGQYPMIKDVRGLGLMIGLQFKDYGGLLAPELVAKVVAKALDHHLILLTCGVSHEVIRFIPPLVVTETEIDQAYGILATSLAEVQAELEVGNGISSR
ncbi:MAG: aminotransferase class III-fold pyridoxal phosphate-dependent enzyme [Lactobacillus sp.]|nr:aminotransferase class III-fold pyridoxal phosphate-dependent enzyme [Lactobacillus sp.]